MAEPILGSPVSRLQRLLHREIPRAVCVNVLAYVKPEGDLNAAADYIYGRGLDQAYRLPAPAG